MRKRIVEITFASGKKEYRVETAVSLFGIPLLWALDVFSNPDNPRGTCRRYSKPSKKPAHTAG